MSLYKEAEPEPGVVDEAAENEFSDDPDRPPLIRIPIKRGRGGRTSSMDSSTGGSGSQKHEQTKTSGTEITPLQLAFAAVCLLFALLVGSYMYISNNTRLQIVIDDLSAKMQFNNAAIERLDNDIRLLKSRGRPEKYPSVETNTETNQDVIYLRSDIDELRIVTTGLPQKLQGIASIKTTINDIRIQVDEDILPIIGKINTELEKTTDKISNVIIPDIAEVKRGVEGATDTISETTNEMNNDFKPKIKILNEDLKKTRYDFKESVKEDFKRLESITDDMKEGQLELVRIVARIGNMSKEQKEFLRDKIEPNMFNKWATTLAIILLYVLQAGSIFAIYVLCGNGQYYGGQADPEYGTKNNRNRGGSTLRRNPILNRIPPNRPLQRLVCIISLEPSTRALHEQITGTVLAGLGVPQRPEVMELLVSSNDDMRRIPAATVNLLFIHFSERHVILEQPGLARGDRHVTAFQAVRQIGGGLAIVYVRDPESRRLQGNDQLYNRNIPVAESPELQRLCDDGAFFSTYDRLTKHQTTSLQRFITEYLDKF